MAIVVDVSDKNWQAHIQVVHDVLQELNLDDKDVVYVFNKIDKVEETEKLLPLLEHYEPHVTVSALSKEGMKPLVDFLAAWHKKK